MTGPAAAAGAATSPGEPYFGFVNRIGYRLLRVFAALVIRPYFRLTVEGLERLPDGPFILAPNHRSHIDPFVLQSVMPSRRIVYMMTREWYEKPAMHWFFRFMRCIAIEEGKNNRDAIERSVDVLQHGVVLGIFPEGRLVTDEALGDFNPGVAAIASRVGVPIVPVALLGTQVAYPRGARFPKPRPVRIRIGAPIELGGRDGKRREKLRDVTTRLRDSVSELVGA